MPSDIKCSFFGHRKIETTEELTKKLKYTIEELIIKENVTTFLFGSRSEFNHLCHFIVTRLKEEYPGIKRIAYTCRSETCVLENERRKWEDIYPLINGRDAQVLAVEEECEHKTKYNSGRASYVERNQAMVDDSNFCVFYYDENYQPQKRKHSKQSIGYYQPKSGTRLAYEYAKQKRKIVINVI